MIKVSAFSLQFKPKSETDTKEIWISKDKIITIESVLWVDYDGYWGNKRCDAWEIHLVGGLKLTIRDRSLPKVLRDMLK